MCKNNFLKNFSISKFHVLILKIRKKYRGEREREKKKREREQICNKQDWFTVETNSILTQKDQTDLGLVQPK
jgi:hypothetical protein